MKYPNSTAGAQKLCDEWMQFCLEWLKKDMADFPEKYPLFFSVADISEAVNEFSEVIVSHCFILGITPIELRSRPEINDREVAKIYSIDNKNKDLDEPIPEELKSEIELMTKNFTKIEKITYDEACRVACVEWLLG